MKIALLGTGKTGSKVMEIHSEVEAFNTDRPPDMDALSDCDVVISFLPGEAFEQYLELLIASEKPVVTGSTGVDWPDDLAERLKDKQLSWIRASNFSLGMNVVREMIRTMSHLSDLFEDGTFQIHEIHHRHKQDAPSGTALSWKQWLDREADIGSERTGDVVGVHKIIFDCADERITLTHRAKDRSIFARGAVWAAQLLTEETSFEYGLLDFNQLVKDRLKL